MLLPVDADPVAAELNDYPLETLYANLAKIPARSMTVMIDACLSGISSSGSVVKNASSIALRRTKTETAIPNSTILTASDVANVASWDQAARIGLFTRHFLKGSPEKATVRTSATKTGNLGELKEYLISEVPYIARRLYMRDQNLQVSGDLKQILGPAP